MTECRLCGGVVIDIKTKDDSVLRYLCNTGCGLEWTAPHFTDPEDDQ